MKERWKYKSIAVLCGILLLPALIGVPGDEYKPKNEETKSTQENEQQINLEKPYLAPALPGIEEKPTTQYLARPLRDFKLSSEQEEVLKAGNFNVYIKYKAYQENYMELDSMSRSEIITYVIGPKLKAALDQKRERE